MIASLLKAKPVFQCSVQRGTAQSVPAADDLRALWASTGGSLGSLPSFSVDTCGHTRLDHMDHIRN